MSSHRQAEDLFARASELTGEAREAFLSGACGDDAELRLEVQRLLVKAARVDSFFADEEGATVSAEEFNANYTEAEGDRVGAYTLRQKIGEGGFGEVWMAEQSGAISRMVALKVVKAGMDTKQVLARFEAERQALAMMDHPNIARILEAGATPAGRPYFAMELVKGVPITEFCREQDLGTEARLRLFQDVCSAVNHAHQKGIIHRDLKPSNVMVTMSADKPVVKVIDFGIAKATQSKLTEKTLFTRFEQFLGTPAYMSPEQAAMSSLDIDTRSDIYSLGVLLYELLAGQPPFDAKSLLSAGYDEMRRIIKEDEPPKPSTRLSQTQAESGPGAKAKEPRISASSLKGDLDWIVMKAIEKDRSRRYETANAFSADIGRYLCDEPVLAAAPSAAYKFHKFARRNKTAIGIAAGIFLVLVAATAVSTWQAVRATRAREQSDQDRERALGAQKRESEAREDAEAVSSFLTDMFQSSEPGAKKGGRDVKVADVLDQAVKALETTLGDRPERRTELEQTLGRTYYTLGLYPEAIALQEKARNYSRKSLGEEHPYTLAAMQQLAVFYREAGRQNEALELGEQVLSLRRKVLGPQHLDTLRTMNSLMIYYRDAGRLDESVAMGEELLALSRRTPGAEGPDTLRVMGNLAVSYAVAGRREEGLAMGKEVYELTRKLEGPEHPDTLMATQNLANMYYWTGHRDEALKLSEEALALSRKVLGPEHRHTLGAMTNLGSSYRDQGRVEEAIKVLEQSLEIKRRVLGEGDPFLSTAMAILAYCYRDTGRHPEALALCEEMLEFSRKFLGATHPETFVAMMEVAESYLEVDRIDDARTMLEELLQSARRAHGPDHPETAKVAAAVGDKYREMNELDRAIEAWQEAVRIAPELAPTQYQLGEVLFGMERYEDALPSLQASLELIPLTDPRHAENKARLEKALKALGRDGEAEGNEPETGR